MVRTYGVCTSSSKSSCRSVSTICLVSSSCSSSSRAMRQLAETWPILTACRWHCSVTSHGGSSLESTVTSEIFSRHACASGWRSSLASASASKIWLPSPLSFVSVAMLSARRNTWW